MKNKKKVLFSICAIFMIAFSFLIIPFTKLDNASAYSYTPPSDIGGEGVVRSRFVSDTYELPLSSDIGLASSNFIFAFKYNFDFMRDFEDNTLGFKTTINGYGNTVNSSYGFSSSTFATYKVVCLHDIEGDGERFSITENGSYLYRFYPYLYGSNPPNADSNLTNKYFFRIYVHNVTESGFNCNVVKETTGGVVKTSVSSTTFKGVKMPSYYTGHNVNDTTNGWTNYNWIEFTDTEGNSICLVIPFSSSYTIYEYGSQLSNTTKYYRDISEEDTYNLGYSAGFGEGEIAGREQGYTTGYNAGFVNGENTGYGTGYNAGIENASNYTFLGMIGAVIDAPIKAFRGLFNFNILGVNLVSLITGLFTLCVIVCIVKLVLGGK